MKKLVLSAALLTLLAFGCQHDTTNTVTPTTLSAAELQLASSIGRLSSSSEALPYVKAYQKANPTSTFSVTISRKAVEAILAQPHTVGLRAHYVTNSAGKLDLLFTGIDKDLNNQYIAGALFTGDQAVSLDAAATQLATSKAAYGSAVRAVAFGSKVLSELLSRDNSTGLRFYFTTDTDKEGNRNLLFTAIDSRQQDVYSSVANARTTDDEAGTSGFPCPQHCPKN